jgi:hypothetical protein
MLPDKITSYASSFSSGQEGVVVVNKGLTSQTVNINIQNFAAGWSFKLCANHREIGLNEKIGYL